MKTKKTDKLKVCRVCKLKKNMHYRRVTCSRRCANKYYTIKFEYYKKKK